MSRLPTSRQIEVLWAIHRLIVKMGWPPSIQEIGKEIKVASLRGVTVHLDALELKGLIRRGIGGARCLAITQEGMAVMEADQMGYPLKEKPTPAPCALRPNGLPTAPQSKSTDLPPTPSVEVCRKPVPPIKMPSRGTAPRSLKDFSYPDVGWIGDR